MTDSKRDLQPPDDHFADLLAKKHEQIIANDSKDQPSSIEEGQEDERIQSAVQVLQLLEQIKSGHQEQPLEVQASVETYKEPSTRKSEQVVELKQYGSIDKLVPDLERLGRFEIIEQIGRGGFGIVVRARDPQLDRDVAIKIPRFETALSPESCQRFEREAKAAAALNHPGIVSVYEYGSDKGIAYIVCELIDGENLATSLARGDTYSPKEAAELISKIAGALEHAHQRDVYHRDIKPSNIFLSCDHGRSLQPLIGDFGLAMMSDQQDFTQTGAVIGTPAYMSPEQAQGDKANIGPATDVYGLGTILYQLLTGQPPFADLPLMEMLDAINRRDPDPPRSSNPSTPRDLESICLKCLEKDPTRRYLSALDLQTDLQRFENDKPVLARRVSLLDRNVRRIRRNPVLAAVASLSLLALVVALIASLWGWNLTSVALDRERQAKNDARETVNRYFTDVAENDLLNVPGLLPLRHKLLGGALEYYQKFLNDTERDDDLLEETERAYFRVGKIHNELGEYPAAIESYQQALGIQNQLQVDDAGDSELLARKYNLLRHLAQTQFQLGKNEEGTVSLDQAINGLEQLVEQFPNSR